MHKDNKFALKFVSNLVGTHILKEETKKLGVEYDQLITDEWKKALDAAKTSATGKTDAVLTHTGAILFTSALLRAKALAALTSIANEVSCNLHAEARTSTIIHHLREVLQAMDSDAARAVISGAKDYGILTSAQKRDLNL